MASLATRLIDRFVGAINPDAGMRRLRARELLTRAYEGASQKDGWRPRRAGASANTDHLADGGILRTRPLLTSMQTSSQRPRRTVARSASRINWNRRSRVSFPSPARIHVASVRRSSNRVGSR